MHPNSFILVVVVCVHLVIARSYNMFYEDFTKTQKINDVKEPEEPALDFEKEVVVDANTGIHYNPYSKQHPGRHVCTLQKNLTYPVKTNEIYCKPVYKKYTERCRDNQICTGVRLIYETSYRDVIKNKITKHITYICCPGWVQVSKESNGCNRPLCTTKCQNGGSCLKPGLCTCLKGFTGQYCETDVNECTEQKPCDQICQNTHGSYRCQCRENFLLQSDGQTCKKEGGESDPGLEAKDLEYELLDKRLNKLEVMFRAGTSIQNSNSELNKLSKNLEMLSEDIEYMKNKLLEMEKYKNEIAFLTRRLRQLEEKTNNIDEVRTKYEKLKSQLWSNEWY